METQKRVTETMQKLEVAGLTNYQRLYLTQMELKKENDAELNKNPQ